MQNPMRSIIIGKSNVQARDIANEIPVPSPPLNVRIINPYLDRRFPPALYGILTLEWDAPADFDPSYQHFWIYDEGYGKVGSAHETSHKLEWLETRTWHKTHTFHVTTVDRRERPYPESGPSETVTITLSPENEGSIECTCTPTGALVRLHAWDTRAYITPHTFTTLAGTHRLIFSKTGYKSHTMFVEVTAGELARVFYDLSGGLLSPCGNYGDVDFDTGIDTNDVQVIGMYVAGGWSAMMDYTPLTVEEFLRRADVNRDGIVDSIDVQLVADYVSGIIDTFPVCEELPEPPPPKLPDLRIPIVLLAIGGITLVWYYRR